MIASSDVSSTRLAGVQKVFLTKINRLSGDESDALAKFLFRGGGLVYFLDGSADAENLARSKKSLARIRCPCACPIATLPRIFFPARNRSCAAISNRHI